MFVLQNRQYIQCEVSFSPKVFTFFDPGYPGYFGRNALYRPEILLAQTFRIEEKKKQSDNPD